VGAAQRSAMERSTCAFSVTADLLAPIQSLDRGWGLESGLGATLAEAQSPWSYRLARSNGRRHIFLSEKRGLCVGKTKRGKGSKIMVLVDGRGLPLGAEIASASPHEVTLIEPLLDQRILPTKPRRLIYDAAADSDPLRTRLAKRGMELVSPHRKNRKKPPTQDGRKLRRYRRRWKIERSIGWLQNFRRLVTRYEYYAHLFHGFVQLACLMVVMRRF
jgi:transposase